jgi:hypothetical protein
VQQEEYLRVAYQEYNRARTKLNDYVEQNRIIPRSQLTWRAYITLMGIIGIGEGAFNFVVFQVFQEILPLTFLMSLAVMVGMPALGHFSGMSARHRKFVEASIFTTVGLAALVGITYLRLYFLQGEASASDAQGTTTPGIGHIMGLAYFFISVMIFVVAIAIAYFYHEPGAQGEQLDGYKKEHEKRERNWRREERRYGKERRCLLGLGGRMGNTRAYVLRTIQGLSDAGIELVAIFRRANRNWRRRGEQPPAYFMSYENVRHNLRKAPDWADPADSDADEVSQILEQERTSHLLATSSTTSHSISPDPSRI